MSGKNPSRNYNRQYIEDPLGNFYFEVESVASGGFSSVDGLNYELEMIEYRTSEDPMLPKYRQGRAKVGPVTFKRCFITNPEIIDWIRSGEKGTVTPKDISVWVHDNQNNRVRGWNLFGCLPSKWSIGSLDGKGNEVLYETLEIVTERIEAQTA